MRIRDPFQLIWVFCSISFVSTAQLLLKLAVHQIAPVTINAIIDALPTVRGLYLAGGLLCYSLSMACWLKALEKLPLSATYPLLALSYPLVYIGALASPSLHETMDTTRLIGMLLIMSGIVLLTPRYVQSSTS